MTASHSSSVMFTITRSRRMPALFTSTWRSPKVSIAVRISRWAPSQSAALSRLATASPPIFSISSTTCCAGARSAPSPCMSPPRSLTTTLAPSCANSSACSRPRPRPAPVMMATRPSSAPIGGSPLVVDGGDYRPVTGSEEQGDLRALVHRRAGGGILGTDDASGQVALRVDDEALALQSGGGGLERLAAEVGHLDRL